jgi:CXXC zinc finger domain
MIVAGAPTANDATCGRSDTDPPDDIQRRAGRDADKTSASRRRASPTSSGLTSGDRTTAGPMVHSATLGARTPSSDGRPAVRRPASSGSPSKNSARRNRSGAVDLPFASVLETALSPDLPSAAKARARRAATPAAEGSSAIAADDRRAILHHPPWGRPSQHASAASSLAEPAKKKPRHEDNSLFSFEILFRGGGGAAAPPAVAKATTPKQAPHLATLSVLTATGPPRVNSQHETRRSGASLAAPKIVRGSRSEHPSVRSVSKHQASRPLSELHSSEAKDDQRDQQVRNASTTQSVSSRKERTRSNETESTASSVSSVTKASLMHLVLPRRRRAPYRPTVEMAPPPRVGAAQISSRPRPATAPSPLTCDPNVDATAVLLARIRRQKAAPGPPATVERPASSESTSGRSSKGTAPAKVRKKATNGSAAAANLQESARLSSRAAATSTGALSANANGSSLQVHDSTTVKRRKKRRSEHEILLLQQSKFRDMGHDDESPSPAARSEKDDPRQRTAGGSLGRAHVPSSDQPKAPLQGRPRGRPPGTAKASLGDDHGEPSPEAPTKRPRGRPRTNTNAETQRPRGRPPGTAKASLGADHGEPSPEAPTKRPRGRPRTNTNAETQRPRGRPTAIANASLGAAHDEPTPEVPTKRPRGRPRTNTNAETQRPLGRPPATADASLGAENDDPTSDAPPPKRPRGRPKASIDPETQRTMAMQRARSSDDSPVRERHAGAARNSDREEEEARTGREVQVTSPGGRAAAHSLKAPAKSVSIGAGSTADRPAMPNSSRHGANALAGDQADGHIFHAPTICSPGRGPQESARSIPLFIHSPRPNAPPSVQHAAAPGRPGRTRTKGRAAGGAGATAKGTTTSTTRQPQHAYVPCGSCRGCQLAIDCGSCLPCKQTINYVGLNLLKPTCIHRVCTSPVLRQVPASKDDVTSLDGDVDSFLEGDLSDVSCAL